MSASSDSLVVLEQHLAERLLEFEYLDAAWPKGDTAVERARIGREREDALSGIVTLRNRIVTGRAETLADAAAQLRRLVVMADEEPRPHSLLASRRARAGRLGAGRGRAGSGRGGVRGGARSIRINRGIGADVPGLRAATGG